MKVDRQPEERKMHFSEMKYPLLKSNSLKLPAVGDDDCLLGLVITVDGVLFNGVQDCHTIDTFAKDDVSSVQVRSRCEREEELRPVGVRSRVRHRENARALMLMNEVLIGKLHSVN